MAICYWKCIVVYVQTDILGITSCTPTVPADEKLRYSMRNEGIPFKPPNAINSGYSAVQLQRLVARPWGEDTGGGTLWV